MGEIRSPYFSIGGDYLGDNAEIHSPYFSFGNRDYHGDNAEIHSSYISVGDYHGEDAASETLLHQDNDVENPYNAEVDIVQTIFRTGKLDQQNNVEKLPTSIKDKIAKKKEKIQKDWKCIYKVPNALRQSKGAIYTPRLISIGPIHYGRKHLQPMEGQKVIYFEAFCNRVAEEQTEKFEDKLWKTIEDHKGTISRCYEDDIANKLGENEFSEMVLFDAVFILEYLLRYKDLKSYGDDKVLSESSFGIRWDLMLLENQLPFFILDELYKHLVDDGEGNYDISFQKIACDYFCTRIKSNYKPGDDNILHFTDLVRYLLSFKHPDSRTREPIEKFYSATRLHEATIKIKEPPSNGCLLNLDFVPMKGELTIPRLEINRYTECIFGNLMALEKCHYTGEEYVCHYLKLFEYLITESKDADLLIKNKIIDTKKDGVEVKELIDKLSEGAPEDFSCYYDLSTRLGKHYQESLKKNIALYFKETYFGDVWKGTATVTATILVLLTFVQAICSVLSLR